LQVSEGIDFSDDNARAVVSFFLLINLLIVHFKEGEISWSYLATVYLELIKIMYIFKLLKEK